MIYVGVLFEASTTATGYPLHAINISRLAPKWLVAIAPLGKKELFGRKTLPLNGDVDALCPQRK